MAKKVQNNNAITHVNDLSRLFVKTLKELSTRGESLTFEALSKELEQNDCLVKLISLANDRRENARETPSSRMR